MSEFQKDLVSIWESSEITTVRQVFFALRMKGWVGPNGAILWSIQESRKELKLPRLAKKLPRKQDDVDAAKRWKESVKHDEFLEDFRRIWDNARITTVRQVYFALRMMKWHGFEMWNLLQWGTWLGLRDLAWEQPNKQDDKDAAKRCVRQFVAEEQRPTRWRWN